MIGENGTFLQALDGELGFNDNPLVTGSCVSQNDASAHDFEGYETPRSLSRVGGRGGLSLNGETLNRENQNNRHPSMNEVIIEN